MKSAGAGLLRGDFSCSGFSLPELLITMAMMGIVIAIGIPSFSAWRDNLRYKQAASEVANSLKTAKSRAITLNQQQRVTFTASDKSFQFGKYSSNNQWYNYGVKSVLPNKVSMGADKVIPFNINGSTFGNYSIRIRDAASSRFVISVERSGRIKVTKVKF